MKNIIQRIIQSKENYGRFLNTLSLLEYVGARKILKSQQQDTITAKVLAHVAEEIRHAQVLKRAAMKIAPEICNTYQFNALLCGAEAYRYFQAIDHAAGKEFAEKDTWTAYLYTTLLIETRAILFYTLFEEVLQAMGETSVFRGILAEEQKHLASVSQQLSAMPDFERNIQKLRLIEDAEFLVFLNAVDKAVA